MKKAGARFAAISLVILPFLASACGASSGEPDRFNNSDASGGSGGQLIDSGAGGSNSDSEVIDTGANDGMDPDSACASITESGTRSPLDIYIMFDKSSSMQGDKWNSAKLGLSVFLNDPDSNGIRVAINFFPRPADSVPACDQLAYKKPRVDFDVLPANAGIIMDALTKESPDGVLTPIYPALGGAILAGIDVAKAQAGHTAVVLLVTDGEPQGPAATCGGVDPQDPAVIAALAKKGADNSPSVLTYVIGLPGASQAVGDQIALAGGSKQSIRVNSTDISGEFQKALATVRGKALPCEFLMPSKVAGGEIATDLVNVEYTKAGATSPELVPQIAPNSQCGVDGGWYYDNQSKPTKIMLCPSSCEKLRSDTTGKVQILLGCQTVIK